MRLLSPFCLLAAASATTPPSGPAIAVPDIVVTAQQQRQTLNDFVQTMSSVGKTGQIARWRTLCPTVIGLSDAQAATITDRIKTVAKDVKLDLDPGHCQPSSLIVFTDDADGVVRFFAQRYPVTFRSDGQWRLDRFVESKRPIRWLSITNPCGGGCRLSGSRLRNSTSPRFTAMIIVVDGRQIGRFQPGEIADYLAMTALANPSPDARPPVDSVMSMFSRPRAEGERFGLTLRDQWFLAGLYSAPMDMDARIQRKAIANSIRKAEAVDRK